MRTPFFCARPCHKPEDAPKADCPRHEGRPRPRRPGGRRGGRFRPPRAMLSGCGPRPPHRLGLPGREARPSVRARFPLWMHLPPEPAFARGRPARPGGRPFCRRHPQHAARGGGHRAGRGGRPGTRVRSARPARAALTPPNAQGHAGDAFTITGSLPRHSAHTSGSVASSHMKWATLAMLVSPGRNRLSTSLSCSA